MEESRKLDYWRQHFHSAGSNIFVVIKHAILIAASDYPTEFRSRRDQITETIFSCQLPRCFGCDRIAQQTSPKESEEFREGSCIPAAGFGEEFKVNGESNEKEAVNDFQPISSNYSFDEAEALTEEMEEENQIVRDVLTIKEIIMNKDYESEAQLFESLRRLQLMRITVEVLKETKIGRVLSALRRHRSKRISHLASSLVEGWKILVDEWMDAAAALTESTPESETPITKKDDDDDDDDDDDGGLPSPPLDEGALLTTPVSMELSQFFDGMNDDVGGVNVNKYKPSSQSQSPRRPTKKPNNLSKMNYDSRLASGPGRPERPRNGTTVSVSRSFKKKSTSTSQTMDKAVCAKLEAAKRKLHEGYQQAENAKKQRTIQVMELHDLPKRGLRRKQIFIKQDSGTRSRMNPRR